MTGWRTEGDTRSAGTRFLGCSPFFTDGRSDRTAVGDALNSVFPHSFILYIHSLFQLPKHGPTCQNIFLTPHPPAPSGPPSLPRLAPSASSLSSASPSIAAVPSAAAGGRDELRGRATARRGRAHGIPCATARSDSVAAPRHARHCTTAAEGAVPTLRRSSARPWWVEVAGDVDATRSSER